MLYGGHAGRTKAGPPLHDPHENGVARLVDALNPQAGPATVNGTKGDNEQIPGCEVYAGLGRQRVTWRGHVRRLDVDQGPCCVNSPRVEMSLAAGLSDPMKSSVSGH